MIFIIFFILFSSPLSCFHQYYHCICSHQMYSHFLINIIILNLYSPNGYSFVSLFPTCQVRVVRFYHTCSPPPFPPPSPPSSPPPRPPPSPMKK